MARRAQATGTIAAAGEFGFLARILPRIPPGPGAVVGPGQDCAVIRCGGQRFLVTVDALVEGVHFEAGWMSPRQIGRKSFLVNASDAAAMGGQPRFCLVSCGVRPSYPARDLCAVQAGIVEAAGEVGALVVGGNLTRAAQLFVSVTLLAQAPKRLVTRRGAHCGDRIYVTGSLGDAALGVRMLRARRGARPGLTRPIRRFREPSPRLRAGTLLIESGVVSAMIDVSDGLVQDLGHICHESGVGAVIHSARLPVSTRYRAAVGADDSLALRGGEDYELLCTVPERNVKRLERVRKRLGCSITCIGEITAGRRVQLRGADGTARPLNGAGHDHFRGRL
ncbi:MAG: thiamine-phosphate kinase [Candidatus Binatia bacterium]